MFARYLKNLFVLRNSYDESDKRFLHDVSSEITELSKVASNDSGIVNLVSIVSNVSRASNVSIVSNIQGRS